MIDTVTLLFLAAYVVGTLVGWWIRDRQLCRTDVAVIIDSLIDQGYLRARKTPNGDTEILKYSEED